MPPPSPSVDLISPLLPTLDSPDPLRAGENFNCRAETGPTVHFFFPSGWLLLVFLLCLGVVVVFLKKDCVSFGTENRVFVFSATDTAL